MLPCLVFLQRKKLTLCHESDGGHKHGQFNPQPFLLLLEDPAHVLESTLHAHELVKLLLSLPH